MSIMDDIQICDIDLDLMALFQPGGTLIHKTDSRACSRLALFLSGQSAPLSPTRSSTCRWTCATWSLAWRTSCSPRSSSRPAPGRLHSTPRFLSRCCFAPYRASPWTASQVLYWLLTMLYLVCSPPWSR
jgi:hypothetical protein